jgi:hypothetical protein
MNHLNKLQSIKIELDKLNKRQNDVNKRFPNMLFELDKKEFERRKLENHVTRLEYREKYDKELTMLVSLITELNRINKMNNDSMYTELNDKIKQIKKEIPNYIASFPEIEEFLNYHKYNAKLTQYKIIQRDIDAHRIILNKKYKALEEIICMEKIIQKYKQYATDNKLEVNDEDIIGVCNNHKLHNILNDTIFECECPLLDNEDWSSEHTINFDDGICSYGSCMYPVITIDIDKSLDFLDFPLKYIKMQRIELSEK